MIDTLVGLSERDLQEAANALRSGRLLPPYSTVALQRVVSREAAEPTARALDKLSEQGFTPAHIATTLDILRADRASRPAFEEANRSTIARIQRAGELAIRLLNEDPQHGK